MAWRRRFVYLLLLFGVVFNATLWLDSLDQYLAARYHFSITELLPESVFQPSRQMKQFYAELGWDGSANFFSHASASDPAPNFIKTGLQVKIMPATLTDSASTSVTGNNDAVAESPTTEQPKLPPLDEFRVLFAGDSMMQGVAPLVISELRKIYPKSHFSDLSKQSTGLTVRRYFDWPSKIKDEIVKQKLNMVVIFLGPNDPWDITEGGQRYPFPSEAWEKKYRERVDEVLEFAQEHQVRLIWIGLPSMRNERVRQGVLLENWIFYEETQKYGFQYMPTDDLLGSAEQPFKKFIIDPVQGNIVVRIEDGIHFNQTGLHLIKARLIDLMLKAKQP